MWIQSPAEPAAAAGRRPSRSSTPGVQSGCELISVTVPKDSVAGPEERCTGRVLGGAKAWPGCGGVGAQGPGREGGRGTKP